MAGAIGLNGSQWYLAAKGNVGIASTSPASLLTVGGAMSAAAYQMNSTNMLTADQGIGWLSIGSAPARAFSGTASTAIGDGALSQGGGYGSAALGYQSLQNLRTTAGWFATAVGAFALQKATGNTSNSSRDLTGIGFEVLQDNTTGSANTAVDARVIVKNSTGKTRRRRQRHDLREPNI